MLESYEKPLPTETILRMRLIISDLFYGTIQIQQEYESKKQVLDRSAGRLANFFTTKQPEQQTLGGGKSVKEQESELEYYRIDSLK